MALDANVRQQDCGQFFAQSFRRKCSPVCAGVRPGRRRSSTIQGEVPLRLRPLAAHQGRVFERPPTAPPAAPFAGRFPDAMTGHDAEPPGARVTGRAVRADAMPAFALRASARQPRPLRERRLEDIRHNIAQERQADFVQGGRRTVLAHRIGAPRFNCMQCMHRHRVSNRSEEGDQVCRRRKPLARTSIMSEPEARGQETMMRQLQLTRTSEA